MDQTNSALLLVIGLSSALQFAAAALALRMIRPSGAFTAWIFLACGFIIQGLRRIITLIYVIDSRFQGDMTIELIGLVISLLMLCGIWKFRPLFNAINSSYQTQLLTQDKITKTNHELEAFVSIASHDLRTPITVINGYVELLKHELDNKLEAPALQYLEEIESQGDKMAALLEDLLTMATVGYVERPERPVDAGKVVDEVLLELKTQLDAAGGTVTRQDLPAVHIPETLLAEIFKNLIGNALCYACKEGDLIEVGGETVEGRLRYYVRDHGAGIPKDEYASIFEMFFRGTTGKACKGSGIGLAIVQKIAQLYGGKAWVEETPNGGSTFWFEVNDH